MNRPRAIAIDCDPGLDDAIAIALAAASPSLAVDLVTTVEGNAPLDMVTANACSVMAALGLSAPVHQGHRAPRPDPSRLSSAIWGGDGSLELAPGLPPASSDAVAALAGWLDRQPQGQGVIVAIGPLSNLAQLLAKRPGFGAEIADLVIMGGADRPRQRHPAGRTQHLGRPGFGGGGLLERAAGDHRAARHHPRDHRRSRLCQHC